jgi:TolB-like protein
MAESGCDEKAGGGTLTVFISHASQDAAIANSIVEHLELHGVRCWVACRDVKPGAQYADAIVAAINGARAVLLVLSKDAVASSHVGREVERAASKQKPIIAFRIDAATLNRALEYFLSESQWIDVPAIGMPAALAKLAQAAGKGSGQTVAADPAALPKPTSRTKIIAKAIAAAAVVIAVAVTAVLGVRFWAESHKAALPAAAMAASGLTTAPPASGGIRIAILPFENYSPDSANAFFTDGLYEEILATLSNSAPGLAVISRTTMTTYQKAGKSVEDIARELGATHVLEGSVRREGDAVRLTLQLIDARTDEHIWSRDYDRTLRSALTLQSEVANDVASHLVTGFGGLGTRPQTRDPQAYDLYLKALLTTDSYFRSGGGSADVLRDAETFASEALARDPSFVAALLVRFTIRLGLFSDGADVSERRDSLMKQDLDTAERLAPNDPGVLLGKGRYLLIVEMNANGAVDAFEAADAAGANDGPGLAIQGRAFLGAGRVDDAIRIGRRGVAASPGDLLAMSILVDILQSAQQPAEALRVHHDYSATPLSAALILWQETGSAQALAQLASRSQRMDALPGIGTDTGGAGLEYRLLLLRVQHRYREMADYLGGATTKVVRNGPALLGDYPLAEARGWTHLLLGNRTAAAQDGREVLDFVAHQPVEKWNRVGLRVLTAEGELFNGDRKGALAVARAVLPVAELPTYKGDIPRTRIAPLVARIYAWAGGEDEAATLLGQLATELPRVLPPAEVVQDPLYALLGGNPRYRALKTKLEAQMAATKLE